MDLFGGMERDRSQNQRDIVEISREEFERSIKLQQEKVDAARQSSDAIIEMADAIKMLSTTKKSQE